MTYERTVKSTKKAGAPLKIQAFGAVAAIIGAVAVPQIFHILGAASGLGTSLGEVFLPMHLPIILAGLLAGPIAGAVSGLLGPIVSFALSGMPAAAMLPFMAIELCAYGLFAGLLRNAAILIAFYAFGSKSVPVSVIWSSIAAGLPGLALQWCLIPLAVYRLNGLKKYER